MAKSYLDTYINTIKSNIKFLNSINQERVFRLDKYITCELIALYFFINDNKEGLSFEYSIEEDNIITANNKYKINDLVNYITMQDTISVVLKDNTIKLDDRLKNTNNNYKLINFLEVQRMYKNRMRNYLYVEQNIDYDSSTFIKGIKGDFTDLTNSLIKLLLMQKNTKGIDTTHSALIYGLINFLLNTSYSDYNKLENTDIKTNEIRVIKDDYQNEEINLLEEEKNDLINQKTHDISKIYYINKFSNDYSLAYLINKEIEDIDNKLHKIEAELTALKNNQTLFNQFFLRNVLDAIQNHNFELRENHIDPLITIFTADDNSIKSIMEFHLSSFINIFNNALIINRFDNTLKLSKKNKGVQL